VRKQTKFNQQKRVAIRNHNAEANLFLSRTFIAFLGVIILVLVLFKNIYDFQVNSYEKYQTSSNSNRIKLLPVEPNRGLIYDRNGVLLAENKPVYSIEVIPEQVDDIKKTIVNVSTLLGISDEQQQIFFKKLKSKRRFKPLELKSRLSDQQIALFSVNQHKYPGVFIDARLKRYYPFGNLTTHTLGYVARISRKEANKLEEDGLSENYAATRHIGKLGLEKYYEKILHGTIGHQEVEVNNQGKIIRTLNFTPPVSGKDLTLTLDIELQMIAKRALAGKRGAVVAIDTRDGGVLAMYSNPSYDGNLFVHGISSKNYKKITDSKDSPFLNRAIQGRYPPASTVKPFLALTGLDAKIITPESRIYDPGWFQIKGVKRKYGEISKWGHGWVNLTKAIEKSCNVYFYTLADKLGIDKISEMMGKFGFGDLTGIDIHEERKGILPSPAWKRARYNQPWYGGETVITGIGQSYWTATPLQLAQATSILVNKGVIKVPHLLKATSEANNTPKTNDEQCSSFPLITNMQYDEKSPIVLEKEDSWDIILDAMHNTAQKPGATAYSAFKGSKYDAAGKTGSAQVAGLKEGEKYDAAATEENKRDNAMFIAFAPYGNPEIVIAVAIENVAKGGGGTNAGPVSRQIMDHYFGKRVIISQNKSN